MLLDTHALIWWGHQDRRLGAAAIAAIASDANEVLVSAVSAIEIATKFRLGKLPEAWKLSADFEAEIEGRGFIPLPITLRHAQLAGGLRIDHKDPFDRLLIAQSQIERAPLVSNETLFDGYGVTRVW